MTTQSFIEQISCHVCDKIKCIWLCMCSLTANDVLDLNQCKTLSIIENDNDMTMRFFGNNRLNYVEFRRRSGCFTVVLFGCSEVQ